MPFTIPRATLTHGRPRSPQTAAALCTAARVLLACTVVSGVVTTRLAAQWTALPSATTASLRGLSVVDGRTVWASGTKGTVVRTTDGGATWAVHAVPGAEAFDLRSIHAGSARDAVVASTNGRIYRTDDGGATWRLAYEASDTSVFLDAIDFWDGQHGMALGDPMQGRFFLLVTRDGGDTWHEPPLDQRPVASPGEAAFAASGSSLLLQGSPDSMVAWIGTGGASARVHRSVARGTSWIAYDTPIRQGGASEGIFSLAEVPEGGFVAVGGHYAQSDSTRANAASSRDGARWQLITPQGPRGYRSGVAFARVNGANVGVAVGPGGSDVSRDGGVRWAALDTAGYHAVRASRDGIFYASGSGGRLARFDARTPH
jgi:photosystem II stability/assembly factor-like uncharacterized protein